MASVHLLSPTASRFNVDRPDASASAATETLRPANTPLGPFARAHAPESPLQRALLVPAQSDLPPFVRHAWPAHPAPLPEEEVAEIHGVLLGEREFLRTVITELRAIATTGKAVWDEGDRSRPGEEPRHPEVLARLDGIEEALAREIDARPAPVGRFISEARSDTASLEGAFWSVMNEAATLDPNLSPESGLIRIRTLDALRGFPSDLQLLREAIERFGVRYTPEL